MVGHYAAAKPNGISSYELEMDQLRDPGLHEKVKTLAFSHNGLIEEGHFGGHRFIIRIDEEDYESETKWKPKYGYPNAAGFETDFAAAFPDLKLLDPDRRKEQMDEEKLLVRQFIQPKTEKFVL